MSAGSSRLRTLLLGGPYPKSLAQDAALLALRLGFGLTMVVAHGIPKLSQLVSGEVQFADPLGFGATPSLFLAGAAEGVAAGLVAAGLLTRIAAVPVITTMSVAFFVVHGADPFPQQEKAFLYLVAFSIILVGGPGRFSIDWLLERTGRSSSDASSTTAASSGANEDFAALPGMDVPDPDLPHTAADDSELFGQEPRRDTHDE
ncbi:MAG TPA: DoxX family protein [Longimicrobiales bacterium]|nr:DoxX family protein [Longimicrobiales bacterium]